MKNTADWSSLCMGTWKAREDHKKVVYARGDSPTNPLLGFAFYVKSSWDEAA